MITDPTRDAQARLDELKALHATLLTDEAKTQYTPDQWGDLVMMVQSEINRYQWEIDHPETPVFRNRGIITVSKEFLTRVLRFPEGTTIVGIRENYALDGFDIGLDHIDLPLIAEGEQLPRVNAEYHFAIGPIMIFDKWA